MVDSTDAPVRKKLLLLSNSTLPGQEWLEYARPLIQEHFKASAESPKTILFVPYAVKDEDAYAEKARKALAPLGVSVISAHTVSDPRTLLDKVDGVFVGGGNTFLLLDKLQRTGLLSAIKEKVETGMPYMGASAGTNIAAPTIKTTNDMPIVHPKSLDALGLVPFQINPHYVDGKFYYEEAGNKVPYSGETRADRIEEYLQQNDTPVVGLREGTVLRIADNKVELLGGRAATIFKKGEKPLKVTNGKLLSELMELSLDKNIRRSEETSPNEQSFLTPEREVERLMAFAARLPVDEGSGVALPFRTAEPGKAR